MPARFIIVDQSLTKLGGHYFEYSSAVAAGASEYGYAPIILANRRLGLLPPGALPPGVALSRWFTHRWDEGGYRGPETRFEGHFGNELLDALEAEAVAANEIVLIHTLGWHQVAELLDALLRVPRARLLDFPTFAILLRYEPREIEARLRGVLIERFQRLSGNVALSPKLSFYTDTERLTILCQGMFRYPFATLPIPFNQGHLTKALGRVERRSKQAPLTIVYAGDARDEKGYSLLPDAIGRLWPTHGRTRSVTFVIQSNFNVPGGEPLAAPARAELEQFPETYVGMLKEPLETQSYYNLIAHADIVLIPYSAQRYEARSSGILIEALAAGKVVVTTRGSWMETQISESHAVLFEGQDLYGALARAIENFESLSQSARALQRHWLARSSPATFIKQVSLAARQRTPASTAAQPTMLFIMDAESMVLRNGASRVALNQLDFLFRAGYRVTALFVSSAASRAEDLFDLRARLEREVCGLPFHDLHVAGYAPSADGEDAHRLYCKAVENYEYSLRKDLAHRKGVAVPPLVRQRLTASRPQFILLNYIHNLPVLERLGLDGVPILCEMHDIQSHQRAIYGKRLVDEQELALEFDLLDRCEHLIAINETEAAVVRQRLPHKPVSFIPVLSRELPPKASDLAGARTVAELIQRSRCEHFDHIADRVSDFAGVDVLIVSSSHLANATGLQWFFDAVYFPHLAASGVSVLVAGSIGDLPGWPEHEHIAFCGRVQELKPLYAATRSVVLPIFEGAGSPVKTMEALSTGKPVVATTIALRGITADLKSILHPLDDPLEFAARILSLLADPQERLLASRNSQRVSRDSVTPRDYDRLLADAVHRVTGSRVRFKHGDAPPLPMDGLVEWSPVVATLNRAIISVITDDVDREALVAAQHSLTPELRTVFCELFDAATSTYETTLSANEALMILAEGSPPLCRDLVRTKRAAILRELGRNGAALAEYSALGDPQMWRDCAWHMVHTGETAELVYKAREAAARWPSQADIAFLFGICLEQSGDLPAALEAYRTVLRLGYGNGHRVRLAMGRTLLDLGREPEAQVEFERARQHARQSSPEQVEGDIDMLRSALNHERYDDVLRATGEILRVDPKNAVAHYLRARGLHDSGRDFHRAFEHYNHALATGFDEFTVRLHRSRLFSDMGHRDQAQIDAQKAAQIRPLNPRAKNLLRARLTPEDLVRSNERALRDHTIEELQRSLAACRHQAVIVAARASISQWPNEPLFRDLLKQAERLDRATRDAQT